MYKLEIILPPARVVSVEIVPRGRLSRLLLYLVLRFGKWSYSVGLDSRNPLVNTNKKEGGMNDKASV